VLRLDLFLLLGNMPHHRLSRVLDRTNTGLLGEAIESEYFVSRKANFDHGAWGAFGASDFSLLPIPRVGIHELALFFVGRLIRK
jgi:hypothetical protein